MTSAPGAGHGVELLEAKLELRPSFPLRVVTKHSEEVCAVLEWFVHTASTHRGGN
ncbi:hypothetical protein [Wenjunlia vitaminophila]|uniref:hypothetical protein n=1 Tax=Wenjunlia vitaminophila TaxID=76728 RepID=UPI00035FB8EB|nr:hypothetical protein [Wenjunlia vitaminophila]